MNCYFKLESSNYVDFGIRKAPKFGEQSYMLGRRLDESRLPPLVFEHDFPWGEPLPHYLTGGTTLASRQFIDLLDRIGVHNYQAFPAFLVNPQTGDEREDYLLFNILGMKKAEDMESGSDEAPQGDRAVQCADIFRLVEQPSSVIVSEYVVESLKSNRPENGWGVVVEKVGVK